MESVLRVILSSFILLVINVKETFVYKFVY